MSICCLLYTSPWDNQKLRQAVACAIDRDAVLELSLIHISLVLATVLGSMLESYYIQTMVTLRGNISGLFVRPICVGLLLLSIFFLLMPLKRLLKEKGKKKN